MDFSIPDHVQDLMGRAAAFMDEHVYPLEPEFMQQGFNAIEPQLTEKRELCKRAGMWAPPLPQEYGGMGLSLLDFAHLSETLGRSPLGHFIFGCNAPDIGNMEILLEFGTDEQKREWLRPLIAGDIRSCFSMTEPEFAGSNPAWMGTMAVKDGDDYVINGHKWFTSSYDGAKFAIVMAVTNPDADNRYARASQIIVPLDTPGFEFVRNISVMGHVGDGWPSHAEVRYNDVRVPQANRLGPEGSGFLIAQARLGPGRIHHCMRWIGICERVFELMCTHAAKREVAPGKPLATRQTVQQWIADSRAEINAARLMVLHAAWKIDQVGQAEAREEVSCIKFFGANILQQVLDRALQAHGGLGVTDDTPIAGFFRSERAARIYDGPDEVHRASLARRIMRGYGVEIGL